jgi:hypothetical protein
MKGALLLLVVVIAVVWGQKDCKLKGPFECKGGLIDGLDFGKDEGDSDFEYYQSIRNIPRGNETVECQTLQRGKYEIKKDKIKATFKLSNKDDCEIGGNAPDVCSCVSDLQFTVRENCAEIVGPNGEVCQTVTGKQAS